MKKAVVFPGIGYHKDKPLLYYSIRLAKKAGYEITLIDFSQIPWNGDDLKNPGKMKELFDSALSVAKKELKDEAFDGCEDILFISKSIGTVVASCYAETMKLSVRHLFFSPVEQFGAFRISKGSLAFFGDSDPLADSRRIGEICAELGIVPGLISGGNHSLETGDVLKDIENLSGILARVKEWL